MAMSAMASARGSMTRSPSSDSSAFSNITVGPVETTAIAAAFDDASDPIPASTPPTSVSDRASMQSSHTTDDPVDDDPADTTPRPRRARANNPIYDIKQLSRTRQSSGSKPRRSVSALTGHTLVDDRSPEASPSFGDKVNKAMDIDWELPAAPPKRRSPVRTSRSASVRERVKKAADKVSTVLGKRTREVMEAGKRKLGLEKQAIDSKQKRVLRELDTGKKGVLDEIDLDVDYAAPPLSARPTKRSKITHPKLQELPTPLPTGPLQKTSDGKKVKKWQTEGLYVGQGLGASAPRAGPSELQLKRSSSSLDDDDEDAVKVEPATNRRAAFLRLPMFNYLDKTRDFTMPFDIYGPSLRRGDERPKDWKMLNRNRLVGEAKDLWEKEDRLPASACVCRTPGPGEMGCEDDCLNRVMQYECNEDNCRLPASLCSNRAFAELQARKEKGGSYDIGVEIVKTSKCGFGIRAARSFVPGQIIMEYTGEIISEAECQRRMREDYKDKKCYYLMELERNLVIDGTKGSMARFINHSCEPNCEVRMVKVNGTPRMAVFAGETGIMTGEELSYDYNFDNFGDNQQACHCGAKTCRGYLSKRLNAAEQKKQAKLADERKRKAAEEAQKLAAAEERRKKAKTARGSNWRGWVAVDDADVKAQLRDEKRQREEAEKNSARARRLAARALPGDSSSSSTSSPRRRQTIGTVGEKLAPAPTRSSPRKKASGPVSRFSEDLARPTSKRGTIGLSTVATTSTEVRESEEQEHDAPRRAKRSRISLEQEDEESEEPVDARKRKSFLTSVGDVVKSSISGRSGALLGSANGKLRQSTLPFARLG